MNRSIQLVVFTLDEQRYALHLHVVRRIVRAVEITLLPKAPDIVLGVINVRGKIIPVVNMRKRFHLPEQEMDLSNQFIISSASRRSVALLVDRVGDVIEHPHQEIITSAKILPDMEYIEGVLKLKDGLILIHDLDTFLSLKENNALEHALKETKKIAEYEA